MKFRVLRPPQGNIARWKPREHLVRQMRTTFSRYQQMAYFWAALVRVGTQCARGFGSKDCGLQPNSAHTQINPSPCKHMSGTPSLGRSRIESYRLQQTAPTHGKPTSIAALECLNMVLAMSLVLARLDLVTFQSEHKIP